MKSVVRFSRKLRLSVLFLAGLGACASEPTGPIEIPILPPGGMRVLFIGNSLTYTNDLPRTLSELAASTGDTIRVLSVAYPNFALIDHVNGLSNALDVIESQPWDYVVLQQGPSFSNISRDTLILATKLLDPHIKAAGGRAALFMAWPHLFQWDAFEVMLRNWIDASRSVPDGLFVPVGEAWRTTILTNQNLRLYGPDNYHPNEMGTYLAALVLYELLTGKDPRLLPAQAVVDGIRSPAPAATVRFLQEVARNTMGRYGPEVLP